MIRRLALVIGPALLITTAANPVAAKDPWKHYYKEQDKRAKAYEKYRRKQAKEDYKFCRKYGC